MSDDIKKKFGIQRNRSYLNRDFQDFRNELVKYAGTYFKDKIQDFSEASMGGLFLDMAAYVGDNMSYYLDHQFKELNPVTVVEAGNIETMVRNAGIKINGNSPASVEVDFYIEVPSVQDPVTKLYVPNETNLPVIKDNCVVSSGGGVTFNLTEELDFKKKTQNGTFIAETTPIIDASGIITSFVFKMTGLCVSGVVETQTSVLSSAFIPFRTVAIDEPHVSSILRVFDSDGNDYYEVESLSQDTVFKKNRLSNGDTSIEVIATPYRYVTETSINTRETVLRFGSGDGSNILEAKVPDASDMALPLYGKQTFAAYSLDPNRLLKTTSLGVSPTNTTLTIVYRHGGGANHNVEPDEIRTVNEIDMTFLPGVPFATAQDIRNSIGISNPKAANGGAAAPTLGQLKSFVTATRTMQNRIVTTDDLLARIYTLPTEFGIVFRANVLPNPENALSSILYVVSLDAESKLTTSSDALKKNLSTYLNEFRLIGDAMDILDASIINYQIKVTCRFSHSANKYELISLISREIAKLYQRESIALGKPIVKSDITNVVINQPGVISCVSIELVNVSGEIDAREYSNTTKNLDQALKDDIYFAEPHEIFELRHPSDDILITVL
tara:strand:- start:1075 stop:2907 length:1833 start_codon:yes stop_codon:yes gene_type:complete